MSWSVQTFRLASSPADPGLFCAKDQLTLGGQPLLIQASRGLNPIPLDKLQRLFDAAYGHKAGIDAETRLSGLRSIAYALDAGDLSRAAMLSLMLRLPDIDPGGMSRLRKISGVCIAKYDEDESHNRRGRWTSGSGETSPGHWPDKHQANPNIVPVQGGGAALPFPFPLPPLMPGNPLNPQKPKVPTIFPPAGDAYPGQGANDNAASGTRAVTDSDPRTCPDPSFEADSEHRTAGQLLYQSQISGLPLGMGVELNGVKFDGCRVSDGTMLEAKTSTSAWFSSLPIDLFETFNAYIKIRDQAFRQIIAAGSRKIEWHFSDSGTAWFWKNEFARLNYRITVKYTPFIATAVKLFL